MTRPRTRNGQLIVAQRESAWLRGLPFFFPPERRIREGCKFCRKHRTKPRHQRDHPDATGNAGAVQAAGRGGSGLWCGEVGAWLSFEPRGTPHHQPGHCAGFLLCGGGSRAVRSFHSHFIKLKVPAADLQEGGFHGNLSKPYILGGTHWGSTGTNGIRDCAQYGQTRVSSLLSKVMVQAGIAAHCAFTVLLANAGTTAEFSALDGPEQPSQHRHLKDGVVLDHLASRSPKKWSGPTAHSLR